MANKEKTFRVEVKKVVVIKQWIEVKATTFGGAYEKAISTAIREGISGERVVTWGADHVNDVKETK